MGRLEDNSHAFGPVPEARGYPEVAVSIWNFTAFLFILQILDCIRNAFENRLLSVDQVKLTIYFY